MRWSMKSLLIYMAALAVCLTISRLSYVMGALALAAVLYALRFALPSPRYRRVSSGASFGIVGSFALLLLVGGFVDAVSALTEREISRIVYPWLPYIFQLGAFAGGSLGLLYDKLYPVRSPRIMDDRLHAMSKAHH